MKSLITFLVLTVATTACSQQPAANALRSLNDVQYKAPAGWQERPLQNNMQVFISPASTPSNQAMMIIGESAEFDEPFESYFSKQVKLTVGNLKQSSASKLQQQKTTDGYDVLTQTITAQSGESKLWSLFCAVHVNRRMLLLSLAANAEKLFTQHQTTFASFISNVQLPRRQNNATASAAPQSASPQNHGASAPTDVARSEDARRQPGVVSGNIYDAQGRPFRIPGAKVVVHIWGAGSNGDRVGFNLPVDANGHYESKVVSGLYGFHARAYMPLNGNVVCVDLEPLDGRPTEQAVHSSPGIVKDFGLRLTGPVAGGNAATIQGYHGGKITITDGDDWKNPYFGSLVKTYPAGSKVYLTLVPQSPLIDGSRGETITEECRIEDMKGGGIHRANIPLAAYSASAVLVTPNGQKRKMKVAALPNTSFADAVNIYFEPNPDDHDGKPVVPNILVSSN